MRKFTTTVRLFLTLAFVFTQMAGATDTPATPAAPAAESLDTVIYKNNCLPKPKPGKESFCTKLENKSTTSGSTSYGCEGDYQAAYKKAQQEFLDACGEAGVASGPEGGNIGCGFAIAQCKCFTGGLSATEKSKLCGGVDEKVRVNGKLDADSAKRMFKYCPAMAGADYKKNTEKLEKSDEKIEKMEEKIPGLREGTLKANRDAMEKQDNLQKEENELDEKHQKELADAKKNMSEEQKKIMDQMSGIQAQIATVDEQIGQYDLGKVDAANRKRDEILKIDNSCRALAVNQVTKRQDADLALLRAGQLNRGGQLAMLKRNGLSDRASWQREADKYYRQCQVDPGIIDQKDAVDRIYRLALETNEKAKKDLRNRKRLLQEQLTKMKDPSGACGAAQTMADGSSNETEMCRTAREAYEGQMRAEAAYAQKKQGLINQKARAAQAGGDEVRAKAEEAALAQRNLDKEKGRRDKMQDWIDQADKKGVSDTGDSKAFNKAQAKFSAFTAQAQNLVVCTTSEEKKCADGNECDRANNFFTLVTGGRKASPEMSTPRSPPAADPIVSDKKPAEEKTPTANAAPASN